VKDSQPTYEHNITFTFNTAATTITTTTMFYGSLDLVWNYSGEPKQSGFTAATDSK